MAVNELLTREKRTAGAVIFREAHPGYVMPVGVWNVRERVRESLSNPPMRFETLESALQHIDSVMDIPRNIWLQHSAVLRDYMMQRRIEDYV